MEMFNRLNVVNKIKRSKLEWTRHVYRKQNSMIHTEYLKKNPRSKRSLGKPRLHWENGIRKDF